MDYNKKLFYKKILITILIITIYYVGNVVQLPGILSYASLNNMPNVLESFNHALWSLSVFSMGLSPYLSASIVSQLLSSAKGSFLHQLKEDQIIGASKLNLFTKLLTIFIACIQSIHTLDRIITIGFAYNIILMEKWMFMLINLPILISGAMLTIWLSNQISSKGATKGVQTIMFVNLLMRAPQTIKTIYCLFTDSIIQSKHLLALGGAGLIITLIVLYIEETSILIPVNFMSIESRSQEYLPIKLNLTGAITVILANHIIQFIPLVTNILKRFFFTEFLDRIVVMIHNKHYTYYIIYSLLIILLNTTYSYIIYDPATLAKNFHQQGIVIEGVEPMEQTKLYLENSMHYINICSSLYLIIICVCTEFLNTVLNRWVGTNIFNINGMTVLIGVNITQALLSGLRNFTYNKRKANYS